MHRRKNYTFYVFFGIIISVVLSTIIIVKNGDKTGEHSVSMALATDTDVNLCTHEFITCNNYGKQNNRGNADTQKSDERLGRGYKVIEANVTAYTASVDETDNTPCITASGHNICPTRFPIVANNCLGFGIRVSIRGVIYRVHDRGAVRHGCAWFDILVDNKAEAYEWGIRREQVKIYEK